MRAFAKLSFRSTRLAWVSALLLVLFLSPIKSWAQHISNSGNVGDYYHNSDNLHTRLSNPETDHPGLTLLEPTRHAVTYVTEGKVVVGNASLAYYHPSGTGDLVSIIRYWFMNSQYGANNAYNQYRANNAYWYPEHRDHDARDNFHSQTPAVTNSQGSSGSEMDEIKRFIWTLAAFHSDTKQLLIDNGLLMPTVQMIMRRTRVESDAEYLSGKAHPNAFDNASNTTAMEQMAADMLTGNIPPMVQLKVIGDTFLGERGKDIFQVSTTQRLYETPVSISRIWKNRNYTNRIIVSAEDSFDVNEHPLTFHWKVLRGNPTHVRIIPENASGSVVTIEIDYHGETVIPDSTRTTNLVSVGAFVHNGFYYSAPGFVTSYTLPSETRTYNEQTGQLLEMSYQDRPSLQIMPAIDGYPQNWTKDVFHYDTENKLTGWTRYDGAQTDEFTPEGYLVINKDINGNPLVAQEVAYSVDYSSSTRLSKWATTGDPFPYEPDPEPRSVADSLVGVWNGFLGQQNVVECNNLLPVGILLSISVTDYLGETIGQRFVEYPGYGTAHTILNDFNIAESYGTYLVEVLTETGTELPAVRCQTMFYRSASPAGERQLEYAYSIPAERVLSGVSSGLYNSMNPEFGNTLPVLNWLSVINPGEQAFSADVKVFDVNGALDGERSFRVSNLAPGDRLDAPLGHPDGQTTGSYQIIPDDAGQVYGAFLTRYSRRSNGEFNFAFTLLAKKSLNDSGPVAASTMGPAINWGEITNISENDAEVEIEVFTRNGQSLFNEVRTIPGRAQYHLFLNTHIGELNVGYFRVRVLEGGDPSGSLLVQSLFYGYRGILPDSVTWAYASQALGVIQAQVGVLGLPINTYFNSANWLKLFNPGEEATTVGILLYAFDGSEVSSSSSSFELSGAADIALHEDVGPNFAGMVVIKSDTPLISEVLRVYPLRLSAEIGYITNIIP